MPRHQLLLPGRRLLLSGALLREVDGGGPHAAPPAPEAVDALDERDPDRPIRCASCRAPITTRRARVRVHGAHEHRRVNPSGHDFHLGCFSDAPGAYAEGEPTLEWTWFPGYAWRIAACRACHAHLGWAFVARDDNFFGLILRRLIDDAEG